MMTTGVEWIQTFTGGTISPLAPRVEDINIRDIAHALALQTRFTGHCRTFYSVAEHSVRVAQIVPRKDRRHALLHDASEAYLCDIARPVKHAEGFAFYREAEDRLQAVIFERFGLLPKTPRTVKRADNILLATEKRDLMRDTYAWDIPDVPLEGQIVPWSWKDAQSRFLYEFIELFGVADIGTSRGIA